MRVLLVYTNLARLRQPVPPAGLAWIAGALRAAGHQPRLLDLCWVRDRTRAIESAARETRPDLIGIGISCLDTGVRAVPVSYLPQIKWIVDSVRAASPGVPIIAGGSGFALLPAEILRYLGLSWGLAGDGRDGVVRLAESLAAGKPPGGIDGLVGWSEEAGAYDALPPASPAHVGAAARAAHDLVDYRRYERAGGSVPITLARSHEAGALAHPREGGGSESRPGAPAPLMRFREPGEVMEEIEGLARDRGTSVFHLADALGPALEWYLGRLLPLLERASGRSRVEAAMVPGPWTPEAAGRLRASGFASVDLFAGFHGSTDGTGGAGADLERARPFCEAARRARLPVTLHVLLGGPGETSASLEQALAFLGSELQAPVVLVHIGVRILPGTQAEKRARSEGSLAPGDTLLWPRFYVSAALTRQVQERIVEMVRREPAWGLASDVFAPAMGIARRAAVFLGIRPAWTKTAWIGWPRAVRARTAAARVQAER